MLQGVKSIFFLGIKGVAMANLAVILKKMGKKVSGVDIEEEFITDKLLIDNEVSWKTGFSPDNLPKNTDLVVYSAAHGGKNNPIIIEAEKKKIKIMSQADLLGELMTDFEIKIAVCGCHGKTTTSSLLSYALNKLKAKPSYIVGSPYFSKYQGADYQSNRYFVIEADEYGVDPPLDKTPKFFKLKPDWIICTNIDFDHPDVYQDIEETKASFIRFFNHKKLILNIDDANLFSCIKKMRLKGIVSYGFSKYADYQIVSWKVNQEGTYFKIKNIGEFNISLFGKHNISNATAVIVLLLKLGFKVNEIKKSLSGFTGAERRLERVYERNNIYLYDDYAHHPVEIKASISALRVIFPKNRTIVIFQPHTYSRTKLFLKEFADSLSQADRSYILPIFASARENSSQFKISSKDITKGKENLTFIESDEQLINQLDKFVRNGDVILTMGAGDVYKLKDKLIKIINLKTQNLKLKTTSQISNLKKNVDISHFFTLKNKVVAKYFFEAKTREDLIMAKKYSLEKNIPIFILGGGSNIAVISGRLDYLVVRNNYLKLEVIEESEKEAKILLSSGYPVSLLIAKSIQNGWSGFEYHQGLPGTIGGAVYMNSKWTKPFKYFGDNLIEAYLVDKKGEVKKVNRDYFQFTYDYSILQNTKEILLEAVFLVKKDKKEKIKKRANFVLEYRKKTQPFGIATCGCFFKNSGDVSAGYLIDKTGLKGFSIGDFYISDVHANFIINKGKGKKEDLLKLLEIIKKKVKEKYNIELEKEVIVM